MLNMLDRHFESKARRWVYPITTVIYVFCLINIINKPWDVLLVGWVIVSIMYVMISHVLVRHVMKYLWVDYYYKTKRKESKNDSE